MSAEPAPKRRRGRPRATPEHVEARRQKLIEAAFAEFSDRGYQGTGIADIAARAGIGHGTYYQYFAGKREIIDEAFDYGVQYLLGLVVDSDEAPAESLEELTAQFAAIAGRIAEVLQQWPGLARLIALEALTVDEELTQRWFGLVELITGMVTGYLANGVTRGFLRADLDASATARAILGTIMIAIFSLGAGTRSIDDADAYMQASVRLIIDGIAACS